MTDSSKNQRISYSLVNRVTRIGMTKAQAKSENFVGVRSLGTQRNYVDRITEFLNWRDGFGLPKGAGFEKEQMQDYLHELVEDPRPQAFINMARQALQSTFSVSLLAVKSELPTLYSSRAYSEEEVSAIVDAQSARHAISTRLSFCANLRAHELLTLRRADELAPSAHRPWREDLFAFSKHFEIYSCTGKGGLSRHVAIPVNVAKELETYRLPEDKKICYTDRKVRYTPCYDICGGQAFSQAFTAASQKALGFSHGAHGLRHSYAQQRMAVLKENGVDTKSAMLILSQEMGHFRADIVLAYLR